MKCLFCDIVNGKEPCHKVWEDSEHLAFLSIFPNTEGFTVVIPKQHYDSYAFDLEERVLHGLMSATQKVAKVLDNYFVDVARTGMFLEGYGVNHVHSKLFPMHGTSRMKQWEPVKSSQDKFFRVYEGYLSSHDCARGNDRILADLAAGLRASQYK